MDGRITQAAAHDEQHCLSHFKSLSYYRPELDVLRFAAFSMVFASHTVPGDEAFYSQLHIAPAVSRLIIAMGASGAFGVDLFFALSSFLITTLLLREQETYGTIDISSFYLRRVLRIWPLYFFFLLLIAPALDQLLPTATMPMRYVLAFTLLAGNWACVLWGYPNSVAVPLWSVSIEEQFYLVWPIVMRWIRHLKTVALMLLLLSFIVRAILVGQGAVHPQIWCNTLARLDPIACGTLLAVLAHRREINIATGMRVALLVASLGLLAAVGRFGDFVGAKALLTFPVATVASILLLLCALGWRMPSRPGRIGRTLIYLGRISYGLYVFHSLFIVLFGVSSTHDAVARLASVVAALLATIAAAAISHHLLEKPFLRLKERVTRIGSRPGPIGYTDQRTRKREWCR
ncbi:MAG TPA: acyltransferase [Steroidobacteraceae bacterium]|nr:acyltransferase [Steroidobacteraceae bacterium]